MRPRDVGWAKARSTCTSSPSAPEQRLCPPQRRWWAKRCVNCVAAHELADRALAHPTKLRLLESEHEQHGLVTLLLQLWREHVLVKRNAAQTRQDRYILLAIDLKGHRRRIEA